MQHGAQETQALVRHRREPDAIPVRVQQPGLADEELKVARERAHLSRELLLRAGRDAVPGARGAARTARGSRGGRCGAGSARRRAACPPELARTARAGWRRPPRRAHRGVGAALALPDELLVAPVDPDPATHRRAVGASVRISSPLTAPTGGIRERPRQGPDGVRLEALPARPPARRLRRWPLGTTSFSTAALPRRAANACTATPSRA